MRERLARLIVVTAVAVMGVMAAVPPPQVTNLRLAGGGTVGDGLLVLTERYALFRVSEWNEGHRDLNGNGSADDAVVFAYDVATQATSNLGLAAWPSFAGNEAFAVFGVAESIQGRDLNGDGDLADSVVHVYDATSRRVINLGLAGGYRLRGTTLAVTTTASAQSPAALVVLDLASGGRATLPYAASEVALGEGLIAFSSAQYDQQHGQFYRLYVYDLARRQLIDVGVHADYLGTEVVAGSGLVLFTASESVDATDFNGDGDKLDRVLFAYDTQRSRLVNLHVVVRNRLSGNPPEIAADGRFAAFRVDEAGQGQDLDGDGSADDAVLFAMALDDDPLPHNLGFAAWKFAVAAGRVAGIDYQRRLHLYEAAGRMRELGDSVDDVWLNGKLLVYGRNEWLANADYNGDGDAFDHLVLHTYDLATQQARNLRVAMRPLSVPTLSDDTVGFLVDENSQGSTDLNGDGLVNGSVAFLYLRHELLNLGLAGADHTVAVANGLAVLSVEEALQRGRDLNGDGDTSDDVVHVVRWRREPVVGERGAGR